MPKWKEQIFVFDDFLSQQEQHALETKFLGNQPQWAFVDDVSGSDGSNKQRPGFNHQLFTHGQKRSQLFDDAMDMVQKAISRLSQEAHEKNDFRLEKSRAFLQVPLANLEGSEYDNHHIDYVSPHIAVLYYICDADGETVLFEQMYDHKRSASPPSPSELVEKIRVKPKRGRVVIFDGFRWHTATQPKLCRARCVINTNLALVDPSKYWS